MNRELNGSKIDKWKNSVKCGYCQMWWGMERFDAQIFTCKRCGTRMVEFDPDFMPIRALSLLIKEKQPNKISGRHIKHQK